MKLINPVFARPMLRFAGYAVTLAAAAMGLVLTTDAFTPVTSRNELTPISGTIISAERVIMRRPVVRPHDQYQQPDTYAIRLVIKSDGQQDATLEIPEPRLTDTDIPALSGARVTSLVSGMREVWELKSPTRTFFTYEDTRATQETGKSIAVIAGPLLTGAGIFGFAMLRRRYRRS